MAFPLLHLPGMRVFIIAAVVASLPVSWPTPVAAQPCPGEGSPLSDLGGTVHAAARIATPPPRIEVQVVLTAREIDRAVDLLWDFGKTPEGAALFQRLMDSAESPDAEQQTAWNAFVAKFREVNRLRHVLGAVVPAIDATVDVKIFYDEAALQRKIKEKVNEYFVTHNWTRWGERFPNSGWRIRNRMVRRPNSIYNRLTWRMIRQMEPELVGTANGAIDSFLRDVDANGDVRFIGMNGSPSPSGYVVLIANGKTVGGVQIPPNGLVDRDVLLGAMRRVASP